MAVKEEKQDLDLDVDQSGKSKKKLLIIVFIILIVMIGGSVAAFFLLSDSDKAAEKGEHKTDDATPAHAPAIYFKMHQTFVINFEDTSKARYFQMDLTVMSRDQHAISLFEENLPVIRNNIITILSSQKFVELNTRQGKQKLNAELLKSINETIAAEVASSTPHAKEGKEQDKHATAPIAAEHAYIEAVYFTSFVMQ